MEQVPDQFSMSEQTRTGFINNSLVLFRLPGNRETIQLSGTTRASEKLSLTGQENVGFLMAPFFPDSPFLLLEADERNVYPGPVPPESFPQIVAPPADTNQRFYYTGAAEYKTMVENIRQLLRGNVAGKVVLSRQFPVPLKQDFSYIGLYNHLCGRYPEAFVYLAWFPDVGLWIGASPETLVRNHNGKLKTMALAGTRGIDEARPWSGKEIGEHRFVVDHVLQKLKKTGCSDIQKSETETTVAGPVAHLLTRFEASSGSKNPAGIAAELHPTPAVCGLPAAKALELIRSIEKHSRSYYAGFLGPFSGREADFFVNLRCMQVVGNKAVLYAGGGLTEMSDPDSEWEETVLKSRTMLSAIEKMQNLAD